MVRKRLGILVCSLLLLVALIPLIAHSDTVDTLLRGDTSTTTPVIVTPAVEKEPEPLKEPTLDERISILAEKYGVNETAARRIMKCESGMNPNAVGYNYRWDKELGKKVVWSKDIGYWQMNTYYQKGDMLRKGWDIFNPLDNLEAGFYLFSKQGGQPWSASYYCHGIK